MQHRTVTILEQDGDVFHLLGECPNGQVEVITHMELVGDQLVLRGTHIDGSGPGTIGVGELRALAGDLGRQYGARSVAVYGAIRTTGANVGHRPRPVMIEVG